MTQSERIDLIEEIRFRAGGGLLDQPWDFYEQHKFWGSPEIWTDEQLEEAGKAMDREIL